MNRFWPLWLVLLMVAGSASAAGKWSTVSVDIGQANDDIDVLRVGMQRPFDAPLYKNDSLEVTGSFEASLNYWHGRNDDIFAAAISPVLAVNFCSSCGYAPYVEVGIGAALLSDDKIDNRDLSTPLLFEDRIGVGLRSDHLDVHVRYMHYSNADISKPNDGIDMFVAGLAYTF